MKIKCFSKRQLNVRKIQSFTTLQPFNFNLQKDSKIAAFWENPENIWSKFSKNSAKFWQILRNFLHKSEKNQQKFQQCIMQNLILENEIEQ